MGAYGTRHQDLPSALFGKTRRAILTLLLTRPGESLYLRQIVRTVRCGQGGVQRELRRLTDAGVLVRRLLGRTALYQANTACPIFGELRGLVVKTTGAAEALPPAGRPRHARPAAGPEPSRPSRPSPREPAGRRLSSTQSWSERMPPELL